jgi:hypothetical protein
VLAVGISARQHKYPVLASHPPAQMLISIGSNLLTVLRPPAKTSFSRQDKSFLAW